MNCWPPASAVTYSTVTLPPRSSSSQMTIQLPQRASSIPHQLKNLQRRVMSKKKSPLGQSTPLYPADIHFPRTHFLYEYEGERAVDPALLVENGVLLWHEQIYANQLDDISPLWAFAEAELEKRGQALTPSHLESLRHQVIINALVPETWQSLEPYPYKGLLISALYLQEARRLCRNGDVGRVWHIVAIAYYNLGLNTTQSSSRAMALYATKGRAEDSELKRAMVLKVLEQLEGDSKINSVAKAKRAVIGFIQDYKDKSGKSVLLDKLRELDSDDSRSSATDVDKLKADNRATTRLETTLNSWASPLGPYPEVAEAFGKFEKKRAVDAGAAAPHVSQARTTSETIEFEKGEYHTRIFNFLRDGSRFCVRIGRTED